MLRLLADLLLTKQPRLGALTAKSEDDMIAGGFYIPASGGFLCFSVLAPQVVNLILPSAGCSPRRSSRDYRHRLDVQYWRNLDAQPRTGVGIKSETIPR